MTPRTEVDDLGLCTDGFHSDECPSCGQTADERDDPANETNAAMNFGEGLVEGSRAALTYLRKKVTGMQGWKAGTLPGIQDCVPRAEVLAAIAEMLGE